MSDQTTLNMTTEKGVARLRLNRPERRNALDQGLIGALCNAMRQLNEDASTRVIVLTGEGEAFCAGGDLSMMQASGGERDAPNSFAAMLRLIDESPKPVVALVNGAAFGGGLGLVAACDMAIAAGSAVFALSETRLGLIPAVISPFVVRAVGVRAARRYFLTAERFDAATAKELGLVHEVAAPDEVEAVLNATIKKLIAAGPEAVAESKRLIRDVAGAEVNDDLIADLEARIAARLASEEGKEGIAAFLGKRKPRWAEDQ